MSNTTRKYTSYILIVLLAILQSFNYQLFIVKNGFAPAGLNGIATMVQYKTGFSIGYLSLIVNTPLCILAFFLIDKDFAVKTFLYCVVYSFVYLFLQKIEMSAFQYDSAGHDTIYPVIIAGLIGGFLYGSCVRLNCCTGGVDIISKYISKKKPDVDFFWAIFIMNVVVAGASFFVYARVGRNGQMIYDYKPVCLCIIYCFMSSFVGSNIIRGTKISERFTIITTHPDEICKRIQEELKHSSTRITAVGSYTHKEKEVIICVVNKHQVTDLNRILSDYDNTFSFSETVNETLGNFKKIK